MESLRNKNFVILAFNLQEQQDIWRKEADHVEALSKEGQNIISDGHFDPPALVAAISDLQATFGDLENAQANREKQLLESKDWLELAAEARAHNEWIDRFRAALPPQNFGNNRSDTLRLMQRNKVRSLREE